VGVGVRLPFLATSQHRTRLGPWLRGKLLPKGLPLLLLSHRGRMLGSMHRSLRLCWGCRVGVMKSTRGLPCEQPLHHKHNSTHTHHATHTRFPTPPTHPPQAALHPACPPGSVFLLRFPTLVVQARLARYSQASSSASPRLLLLHHVGPQNQPFQGHQRAAPAPSQGPHGHEGAGVGDGGHDGGPARNSPRSTQQGMCGAGGVEWNKPAPPTLP